MSCELMLHHEHELMLLLLNTLLKDLDSNQPLFILSALNCISRLANAEMVPALHQKVARLVKSSHVIVLMCVK